jgi:hypothetical protein
MFDYKAGEKYKLTLIMVGFAGIMAGMFFTMLLMPTEEPASHHKKQMQKWESDPDVTGGRGGGAHMPPPVGAAQAAALGMQGKDGDNQAARLPRNAPVDTTAGLNLMTKWLNLAWDMSAGSAAQSQEQAMQFMTPACRMAYQSNVWTSDVAKQIEDAGLKSKFQMTNIQPAGLQPDGTLAINVEGQQTLMVPGKPDTQRQVKLQYLLQNTQEGICISGISEI